MKIALLLTVALLAGCSGPWVPPFAHDWAQRLCASHGGLKFFKYQEGSGGYWIEAVCNEGHLTIEAYKSK